MRIAVAYFLSPPGESVDIDDFFRSGAMPKDGLQHVHVHESCGLVLVTMFLTGPDRSSAIEAADGICSRVTAQFLSPSWVLLEVAVSGA
ncbi:hypothetical protein SSPIM334S_08301 [Streptomyces spiroverticillatus]|nr:hypothetical protein [Streptomyces finlayi]